MAYLPKYLLVLFAMIGFDFVAARLIEPRRGWRRRALMISSLAVNLGALAYFKYAGFFFGLSGILLPLGVSFHTFQSMAYVIEVFRGNYPAERNLLRYALYVIFWPQVVAGPIERPQHLLPQLAHSKPFESSRCVQGARLMLWGFIKKMVVADRLAMIVNPVFERPQDYPGWALCLATLFFTFQIYGDFSGYTDIARGCARILGFDLIENFRHPYLSTSFGEFWRRWHISLSSWFRDYLYKPLGGSRRGWARTSLNILIVFLLSGLWHGANLTFVVWGAWHGTLLLLNRATGMEAWTERGGWRRPAGWVITFAGVALGWIWFRAASLGDAVYIFRHLLTSGGSAALDTNAVKFDLVLIALILIWDRLAETGWQTAFFARQRTWGRWAIYYAGALAWWWLGIFELRQFIYFNF